MLNLPAPSNKLLRRTGTFPAMRNAITVAAMSC
jgi:hypothetical protein